MNFIHGLLDECPAEQQVPAQHKSTLMTVITLGEVFLEPFPSFRAPGSKACCSLWHCVSDRNRCGASSQHKRQPSALGEGDVWPTGRQPRAIEQAPNFPFSHPDGCYETRKHGVPECV